MQKLKHLLVIFALALMLGMPGKALAAHEVTERRTSYGGQIFVKNGHNAGWSMALRVRRAYRACVAEHPDTGCHITYAVLDGQENRNITRAIVSHNDPREFAFNSISDPSGESVAEWLAKQEGLQTRTGIVIWTGPSDQFGKMTKDFRATWLCSAADTSNGTVPAH